MSWAAANVPKANGSSDGVLSKTKDSKKRSETVEAALSRLSKAYSLAMECYGAMHEASAEIIKRKKEDVDEDSLQSLKKVAIAARGTLERTVLMDPLIVAHSPCLRETIQKFADADTANSEKWKLVCIPRPEPPKISSKSHRATVRQLAYLSLTNYADLLMSVCTCCFPRGDAPSDREKLLDRGVVKKVQGFSTNFASMGGCCWQHDSEEDIQRLALVALCDASTLDGSDPVVWVKLACAARAMGRIEALPEKLTSPVLGSFRRLERHALENGYTALPPNAPPNRIVTKLLQEFHAEDVPNTYPAISFEYPKAHILKLDLTRYSWASLGRILMRACREGTAATNAETQQSTWRVSTPFASPVISVIMSPMLQLPPDVLSTLLSFLENDSIWKLEATCRALSVSIMSVRTATEKNNTNKVFKDHSHQDEAASNQAEERTAQSQGDMDSTTEQQDTTTDPPQRKYTSASNASAPVRIGRVSKRVRSQQMTSDKKEERRRRRKSVEFCLCAAALGCTMDDESYKSSLKAKTLSWDNIKGESWVLPTSADSQYTTEKSETQFIERDRRRGEAIERTGPSSLSSFLHRWSLRNSGPLDLLLNYLRHVAHHVEDIFLVDPADSMVLSSCIMSCYDLVLERKFQNDLLPGFFIPEREASKFSLEQSLESFAMDVLHVELRFKRCERQQHSYVNFDDDLSFVSCMVPRLLQGIDLLDGRCAGTQWNKEWIKLRARCFWLAAGLFLWRSRFTSSVCESIEAEEMGLKFIDSTIDCLNLPIESPMGTILTPHLESPVRTAPHWKKLSPAALTDYRDEIQASSVVSLAQQQFQERTNAIRKRSEDGHHDMMLVEEDVDDLTRIGETLFARYVVPFGEPSCKHGELLDNFLSIHGDEYLSSPLDDLHNLENVESRLSGLDKLVPSIASIQNLVNVSSPSILSILVSCLQAKTENRPLATVLLVRLVLVVLDRHEHICRTGASRRDEDGALGDNFSDSEDDASEGNGEAQDSERPAQMGYAGNALKCGRFAKFLIDKVHDNLLLLRNDEEKLEVARSDEFTRMIHHSLAFCSGWSSYYVQYPVVMEEALDKAILMSLHHVMESLTRITSAEDTCFLQKIYFRGLMRIMMSQQLSFSSLVRVQGTVRARRAVRQRLCLLRAEFIGVVFCELGHLFSKNLFNIESAAMTRSHIVDASVLETVNTESEYPSLLELSKLCTSLLWFWKYAGVSTAHQSDTSVMSSFDRPIVDRLRIPLAVAIVGFCGSASCTRKSSDNRSAPKHNDDEEAEDDHLCLTEFFDSDASAHDLSDGDDNEGNEKNTDAKSQQELLRVISHVVYCVGLVFGSVDEKEVISFKDNALYETKHGPLLPLIVARVLNPVADALLLYFRDDEDGYSRGLWSDSFPSGTRSIGAILDSALYKAYKCLHGFTIVGTTDQTISVKENIVATHVDIETKTFVPESTRAAAQLYRCIVRARKRSPPKAALETVSSALPPLEENEKTKKIRDFLFSAQRPYFDVEDVVSIVTKSPKWDTHFGAVPDWGRMEKSEETRNDEIKDAASSDEIMRVRKGIFSLLAQGDLPTYSAEHGSKEDERFSAARFEGELSKKFNAILNNLSYGDTDDIRGWFKAAQCLLLKAETVSDRLGMSKGYSRNKDFFIPKRPPRLQRLDIAALKDEQQREQVIKDMSSVQHLGDDLSIYVHYKWSRFESLESLSALLLENDSDEIVPGDENNDCERFVFRVKKDILEMQRKGHFIEWQQAWGGMFVTALKKVAVRCMCLAVYLFHMHCSEMSTEDRNLMPELLESLGIKFYSDILGSQSYGYPMHVMTEHRKRQLADACRICLQTAVDLSGNPGDTEEGFGDKETWDLVFIIGKCHEKTANTFHLENYSAEPFKKRLFEQHMEKAFECYRAALDEKPDDNGEAGGSSHGTTEIFYRLHATRLKCLIMAVNADEQTRDMAEEEALRLTEKYWFSQPANYNEYESLGIRERMWSVLSDVVAALAQCRLEHPFFHRSVYRHAQALMWAPLVNDPTTGRLEGSRGTVPPTRSCHLRGLNHATNAASSALAVMSSLFEKKRSQLCAVWVTTSYPPSTFETLNDSIRKYDSLRGKYISAYIYSLRLCGKRNELETLLRWISASKRDLPSTFQATARARGGRPEKPHTHDSLLSKNRMRAPTLITTLKRRANSAMADVIKEELTSKNLSTHSVENHLKLAYACYLRLNCTQEEITKSRAWKYEPGSLSEVEALCQAYLGLSDRKPVNVDPNDWSGGAKKVAILKAALEKCKELFPTLSGTFYSKKTTQKTKSQNAADKVENIEGTPQLAGTKRSFEVAVPDGLSEGETFTTTIRSGGNSKKVKLTVPGGNPRMLRFSLDLSTQTYE